MEGIHDEKVKYLDEIGKIKNEKEKLHAKINKSVENISEEKNKWKEIHNKLIRDNEELLKYSNEKDATILSLKDEISCLKNKLNEKVELIISNDAKNIN
jgi:uncharacterized coiled-coil DUF342 family protein